MHALDENPFRRSMARRNRTHRPPAVLIVTRHPEKFVPLESDARIVESCHEAVELLRIRAFAAIFCDMGQLGPRESGFRFAQTLKHRQTAPPLFLMVEQVTSFHATLAMLRGAAGLVRRDMDGLRTALLGLEVGQDKAMIKDSASKASRTGTSSMDEASLHRIKAALRRYIGPTADHVADRTLASIAKRRSDDVPFETLVRTCAHHIDDPRQRIRFLNDMHLR